MSFLVFLHIGICLFLVITVILHGGKGADMGASFGGSSQTVFGSTGGVTFFTKLTSALVAAFFLTSILLAYVSSHRHVTSVITPTAAAPAPAPATTTPEKAPEPPTTSEAPAKPETKPATK